MAGLGALTAFTTSASGIDNFGSAGVARIAAASDALERASPRLVDVDGRLAIDVDATAGAFSATDAADRLRDERVGAAIARADVVSDALDGVARDSIGVVSTGMEPLDGISAFDAPALGAEATVAALPGGAIDDMTVAADARVRVTGLVAADGACNASPA